MEKSNAKKLLVKLNSFGIKLWLEGETLRFLAPPNTFSAALREQVKQAKTGLIAELQVCAKQFHPVSSAQKRIWLGESYSPNQSAYNVPMLWHVKGRFHESRLMSAIQHVVKQNDVFRQSFHFQSGELVSQYAKSCELPLTVHDWRESAVYKPCVLTDEEKLTKISRLPMVLAPFDLAASPLCRADYFKFSDDSGAFLIVFHHLIIDELSATSFMRQLRSCIRGSQEGEQNSDFTYQDYVIKQKSAENSPAYSDALRHYQHQLGKVLPHVSLPYKKQLQPLRVETDSVTVNLSDLQSKHIAAMLAEHRTTDFVYFLSAFMVLLQQGKKEQCIQLTTPVSCIPDDLDGEAMGVFQNIAVIGALVSPQTLFSDLLKQVKKSVNLALDNRELAFEDVVSHHRSGVAPSPQLLFLKQTVHQKQLVIEDATFEPIWFGGGAAKSDLLIGFTHHNDRFVINFEYKVGCFEKPTIEELARKYRSLLLTAIEAINSHISELQPRQRPIARTIPCSNNKQPSASAVTEFASLTSHLDNLAIQHPHKFAIDAEISLTYQQLKKQSDGVAHALQKEGVSAGQMVGLCMQRNTRFVVSLLAILKVGACYVPLDDSFPGERLKTLCREAKISAVICSKRELNKLQESQVAPLLCFDSLSSDQNTSTFQPVVLSPEDFAYVIHTSGSTGKPKGVCVSHQALMSFLSWCKDWFSDNAFEHLYASTPISFDVSVFEMFASLFCGGTLRFIRSYSELPEQSPVGLSITAVPSVLKQFLYGQQLSPAVETVYLAGEAVDTTLVELIKQRSNIKKVFNLYGPTESVVYAAGYEWPDLAFTPCIGKVRTDLQSYVLDDDLNLLAAEQVGQLALAGTGIANGYLHLPVETERRFVPNPYSDNAESHMYLTGDLVRRSETGNLEYIGRLDDQLKINGVRIEPLEIESLLIQDDDVEFAFVGSREVNGRKLLLAAVKLSQVSQGAIVRLRRHCLTHLPAYLVPHVFLQIQDIPLNSNGKVDRKNLQRLLDADEAIDYGSKQATRCELQIGRLWEQVLGVEEISFKNNFFEAGGGSMQLLELKQLLEQTFNLSIPIVDIFASPTVTDMAELISLRLEGEVQLTNEQRMDRGIMQRKALGRIGQKKRRLTHE